MSTRPPVKLLLGQYNLRTLIIKREAVIERAKRWDGIPYRGSDGNDPNSVITGDDDPVLGVNCSGFWVEQLRGVGAIGPNERPSALELYLAMCHKTIKGRPMRGDFLFYGKLDMGKEPVIGHMAMMVDDWHFYEAGGGARGVDTLEEAAKRNAFVRMRPVEFRVAERVAICRIWE